MANPLQLAIGFETTAGLKPENQDAVNYVLPEGQVLENKGAAAVLADGVSISEAARQASHTAVQSFLEDFYSTPETWSTKNACQQVITAINSWLYKQGSSEAVDLKGWVTTFDAIVFKSNTAYLFHVGDARIYRLRQGELQQLTKDHTAWMSKQRSYLSRALGVDTSLQIDFRTEIIEPGDVFLMTSDGVHEFVSEDQMTAILQSSLSETDRAKKLVALALSQQSADNLTAQVITVLKLPSQTEEELFQKLLALPLPPELEPGMKIDGYKIVQEISVTPRSQIYLAEDVETGQSLVLKTPSANYSDDPWYLDGFVREEWLGQKLKHPGLMKTYQRTRPKTFLYFTSEFIQGKTLSQWMHDNPQPSLDSVRELVKQMASALRALHRLDIIHQDLKPDNIMIDCSGRVKIIDFGAVHVASLAETATVLQRQHPEGTLNYTAPEYLLGEPGSNRSDMFSLVVITYQMLTGALPYKEKRINPFSLRRYQDLQYLSARQCRADLPEWLDLVLKKGCAPNPLQRFALLSEFTANLFKPDDVFLKKRDFKPLLERNPTAFWQGVSAFLLFLLVLQWFLLV
ncbi:protein kinase [Thiosulfatimonas sediminis]|uniref:Protein kinase n=1 Tax=Thiosulfatimonas sediminis TaxID=2675054 RepID=A0A6F8PVP6_9GAMM|nr:bifunctional protein-serine/threonine kinase/phosphatase [Thiosulfatimonas sediminis]BBP46195.1 protein kinase [Thiosulfatimonas sediminis]